ncbi:MAG: type IV toxin-antitoxin system AbiEi family antitoxin [Candidatus Micrarchaeia archaeon]
MIKKGRMISRITDEEKSTLTAAEQRLLAYLTKDSLISTNRLREIYNSKKIASPSYFKIVVSSLIKKKIFLQIKKGLYYVTMGETYDEFLLGQYLFGGYIGFSTALWLHGLKTEMPSICYVAVYKGKKTKKIGRMLFKSVSLGEKAIGAAYIDKYRVSTKAKTFFDCFLIPKYAGGFQQILYSLSVADMTAADWNEFLDYIKKFGSSSMVQRVGYVFSILRRINAKKVPNFLISELRKELERKGPVITTLDPTIKAKGRFVSEWKIYDNVGEKIFGSLHVFGGVEL